MSHMCYCDCKGSHLVEVTDPHWSTQMHYVVCNQCEKIKKVLAYVRRSAEFIDIMCHCSNRKACIEIELEPNPGMPTLKHISCDYCGDIKRVDIVRK